MCWTGFLGLIPGFFAIPLGLVAQGATPVGYSEHARAARGLRLALIGVVVSIAVTAAFFFLATEG